MQPRWRVDLHAHTSASADGLTRPGELVRRAAAAGLHRIAVTDHGEIHGALRAREAAGGERVIVGEEIGCACGTELVALFLHERIPQGLPIAETAARIRGQGGVVYAPHPFAYRRRAAWHAERALAHADVAEAFNARAFLPEWNRRAAAAAAALGMPAAAGSDAHLPWEIGRAWTEIPPFEDAAELRAVLHAAVPVGRRTGTPAAHLASRALYAARSLHSFTARARGAG
jgi:predicted metal-dependent phosphoesterase TrpH